MYDPALDLFADELVFATCEGGCQTGAIFVPHNGPMGDHTHTTTEEAIASGIEWAYHEEGGWMCPPCYAAVIEAEEAEAAELAAAEAAEAAEAARIAELLSRTVGQSLFAPRRRGG